MVVQGYNTNTWEAEAGGSRIQGQPQLHRELKASLGYMRPYFLGGGGICDLLILTVLQDKCSDLQESY